MRLNIAGLMRSALPLAALLLLAACPNTTSYTIGGTVTGLASSPGPLSTPLILQNNGGDNLTISAIGAFTFATAVTSTSTTSATYNVTIRTQPFPQTCTVTGGRGIASSNVTSVVVSCSSSSTSADLVNASNNNVSQYTMGANGALNTSAARLPMCSTPHWRPSCIAIHCCYLRSPNQPKCCCSNNSPPRWLRCWTLCPYHPLRYRFGETAGYGS